MLNNNDDVRVLSRMGARDLTPEESEQIGGSNAFIPTLLSVIVTHSATGAMTLGLIRNHRSQCEKEKSNA